MRKGPTLPRCCGPLPADLLDVTCPSADDGVDEELAAFARALAQPVRVRILRMLARHDAEMCAAIVSQLPLAQSTVSEHLRVLREARLVATQEEGARTSYCLDHASLRRLKALLEQALPSTTRATR